MYDQICYQAYLGLGPRDIPHIEFLGCPDAETYITGIDYFEHPRQCRLRLQKIYPKLNVGIPKSDAPIPRPELNFDRTVGQDEQNRRVVRWGDSVTHHWDHDPRFRTVEDVFAYSPLEEPDFTDSYVVTNWDYSSSERLYNYFYKSLQAEWGEKLGGDSVASVGTYQTMFMWPLLSFGWELFMEACLDPRFERVMNEFAELNRRLFQAFARLPVRFVFCHDDIVNSRGPICSSKWMNHYIFPRYEEYWSLLKEAGKRVFFVSDGCVDKFVEDLFACGAAGILGEPYNDYKAIARKYQDCYLAGEGDTRILSRNDPLEIRKMVDGMVETARMTGGYFMRIGNEFTWTTPVEAVKLYLDLSHELAHR